MAPCVGIHEVTWRICCLSERCVMKMFSGVVLRDMENMVPGVALHDVT